MLDCRIDARPDVIGPESQAESEKETPSIGDFDFDMTTLRKHVISLPPTTMTPLPVPLPSSLSLLMNLEPLLCHPPLEAAHSGEFVSSCSLYLHSYRY